MQEIASIASFDGKFTNLSGRKTVIQSLRDEFQPLEMWELTCRPTDSGSITNYSHKFSEKTTKNVKTALSRAISVFRVKFKVEFPRLIEDQFGI